MSTRCQIAVMDGDSLYDAKIYKHCDGYPDGVLPVLAPFARRFAGDRGADPEYLVAQVLRHFARAESGQEFTGWGVSTHWHLDIEYVYVIHEDGRVDAYEAGQMRDAPSDAIPPGSTLITA